MRYKLDKKAYDVVDVAFDKVAKNINYKTDSNIHIVTGLSGSGKSTLSKRMKESNPDLIRIELDGFQHNYDTSEIGLVNDFISKNGLNDGKNKHVGSKEIIEYLAGVAKDNPSKKYLLEGIQSIDMPKDRMKDFNITLVDTPLLKSTLRRYSRDKENYKKGNFPEGLKPDGLFSALRYNIKMNSKKERFKKDLISLDKKAYEVVDVAFDKVAKNLRGIVNGIPKAKMGHIASIKDFAHQNINTDIDFDEQIKNFNRKVSNCGNR